MRTHWLVVFLVCACAPSGGRGETDTRRDAILSATPDPATSSVFLLDLRFSNNRASICSATLVSPKVLLTAAHCIDAAREGAATVTVTATNKADDSDLHSSDFIAVTRTATHPQYGGEGAEGSTDLALLLLASAPAGVAAKPLLRTAPGTWLGQSLRLVGYGRTAASVNDGATRRSALVSISQVTSNELKFGTAGMTGICSGDSGGPGLITVRGVERVAGVHSYVTSSDCGIGSDIRVDSNLSFIDSFISTYDATRCVSDGRCDANCSIPDADCNVPDPCAATDGTCDSTCVSDPDCLLDGGTSSEPGSDTAGRGGCSLGGGSALTAAMVVLANALRRRAAR